MEMNCIVSQVAFGPSFFICGYFAKNLFINLFIIPMADVCGYDNGKCT